MQKEQGDGCRWVLIRAVGQICRSHGWIVGEACGGESASLQVRGKQRTRQLDSGRLPLRSTALGLPDAVRVELKGPTMKLRIYLG